MTAGHSFRWFVVGRTVDLAGGSMTPVTLVLTVLAATGSPGDVGIIMAAGMAPYLLLMVLGGAVADRVSRRSVLVATSLVSAAAQGRMATQLLTTGYHLPTMAALAAAGGAAGAFNSPALRGIVPELVPAERLQQANAALASVRNATRIGGPALAGVLVSTVGGGWALAVDAASFLLAAVAFTRIPASGSARVGSDILTDLREGWTTFASLRWVWLLSLAYAFVNAVTVGPWQILGATIVGERDSPAAWGVVVSVRALGLLLASLLLLRITFCNPLATGLRLGALAALPLVALGLTDSTPVVAVAAAVGAIGMTAAGITYESTLQARVPPEKLSRVASYDDLLSFAAIPVSQLAVGPLADAFGAGRVALASGVLLVVVMLVPLSSREVRDVSRSTV